MTLTINDNDGKPMSGWLQWTPGIASAKDPTAFGKLQLIDSPPAGDKLIAYLAARRDLSGLQDAHFELNVLSAEPLGGVEAAWRIEADGKLIRQGDLTDQLAESSDKVTVDMQVGDLPDGQYTFTMSLARGGTELARVSEPFVRFSAGSLAEQLEALKQRRDALLKRVQNMQKSGRSLLLPRSTLATVGEFLTFTDDDLKKARNVRAHKVLNELKVMLDEAEAEIADLQAHPDQDFVIPDFAEQRITVRDGAFWSGERPVFLIGVCGWWKVWNGMKRLVHLGLNSGQESIGATPFGLFETDDGKPVKKRLNALNWAFGWAGEAGCTYSRMLACNQYPDWLGAKHPDATGGGWGRSLSLVHPEVRAFSKRHVRTVASVGERYWPTATYILWGEQGCSLTAHPLEQQAFRQHLQSKFGSVDKLNAAWGTDFESFDDPAVTTYVESPVARFDRARFNQQLFTDWNDFLAKQMREEDPDALVTAYPSLLSWDDSADFTNGLDVEALCNVFDVNSCDTAALEYGGSRWAMTSITGFTMIHDLMTAFNPDHPNFDPELHLCNLRGKHYPPAYIQAAMLQAFLHSLSATNLWVYDRHENIDTMLMYDPRAMEAYGRTGLHLQRLVEPIRAFQRAEAEVGILYSLVSTGYNASHLDELPAAFEGTFFLDTKCAFVSERTALAGGLDDLKLLILPHTSHVPAPVAEAVLAWVKDGGTLLAIGTCFTHDQANRPLPIKLASEDRIIVRRSPTNWDGYHQLGEQVFAEAGIARPIRVVDPQGDFVKGIEMRTAMWNDRRLIYLVNMNKTPTDVALKGFDRPVTDLLTALKITWPHTMSPLAVLLLEESNDQ